MSHIDWAIHYYHWYRVFSKRVSIGRSERFSFLFFCFFEDFKSRSSHFTSMMSIFKGNLE